VVAPVITELSGQRVVVFAEHRFASRLAARGCGTMESILPPGLRASTAGYHNGMGVPMIRYYPSAEEQRAVMCRHLRGRMYAFFGVIAASAMFDALAVWWIVSVL
jgi:hypothetical protein